jgi:hypothetical protein
VILHVHLGSEPPSLGKFGLIPIQYLESSYTRQYSGNILSLFASSYCSKTRLPSGSDQSRLLPHVFMLFGHPQINDGNFAGGEGA